MYEIEHKHAFVNPRINENGPRITEVTVWKIQRNKVKKILCTNLEYQINSDT